MININDEHPLKAKSPIKVTDDGIMICFNNEHSIKAFLSIEVMDDGIVISVKFSHPEKGEFIIELMNDGISNGFFVDLHHKRVSYMSLFGLDL